MTNSKALVDQDATPFLQSLPRDPDQMELVGEYDRRSGTLSYRNPENGQTFKVPNIWYNQPSEVRLAAARYYLDVEQRGLARLRASIPPPSEYAIAQREKMIARSKRSITSLERKIAVRDGRLPSSELLFTREEVAEHIARFWHLPLKDGRQKCRTAWIEEILTAAEFYHLRLLPVQDIPGYDCDVAKPDLAKRYARLQTAAPAIVLATAAERTGGDVLIDGYHRLRAAFERGDKDILAFVPVEG